MIKKLILLLFWVDWVPVYPKMSEAKFSDPLTPFSGPFSISLPLRPNPYLAPQILDGL